MNEENQRIAIAEVCELDVPELNCHPENECWPDCLGYFNEQVAQLLDYLNDLNAMREAVMSLDETQQRRYIEILGEIIERDVGDDTVWAFFSMMNPSAKQMAEAFLKTLLLWEEE